MKFSSNQPPFEGGSDLGPPEDSLFDSAFEEVESVSVDEKKDPKDVVDVGLHFFEQMKKK